MERTLFHATNNYFVPNVEVTAYCCRTHLPPNTAFRGFGGLRHVRDRKRHRESRTGLGRFTA
ncbi:MAG: molybdopterin cofactor-binding domain-containing protein [Flavobacteriales bacterium]